MVIIPKIGDWVDCYNVDPPGKVIRVDLEKKEFSADFFTEWTSKEDEGGTGEATYPFEKIKSIITNPEMVASFEEELRG